jgi:hypothetical protein
VSGSRLQKGDEDLEIVPVEALYGRHVVIEEKLDGANSAVSFDAAGKLHLQSRGHFLQGGPRELQFTLFKQWASAHQDALYTVLGDRYIAYGEWLYSKHTVFYDALPHYWLEFDVFDRRLALFLDTAARAALFQNVPVVPVRVLYSGLFHKGINLADLIGPSLCKTTRNGDGRREQCSLRGFDFDRVRRQTDMSALMEGLYIKVEEGQVVQERYKLVRADFVNMITEVGEHHLDRAIVPNLLADGVDLFAQTA